MTHYDEHTLTSYVLGLNPKVAARKEIALHLEVCYGCRDIVERLSALYEAADRELKTVPFEWGVESEELMQVPRESVTRRGLRPGDIEATGLPIGRRVMRYAYRHPVTAGAAGLAAVGLLVLSGLTVEQKLLSRKGGEPAAYEYNARGTGIEVFDRDRNHLWSIPVKDGIAARTNENEVFASWTGIADIEGNGRPDVITTTVFVDGSRSIANTMRVFDDQGILRFSLPLGRKVSFQGGDYQYYFGSGPFTTLKTAGNRPGEIIAVAVNYRSPCGIYRITPRGETLGEYWHYGWLRGMCVTTLAGMNHEVVVLSGVNEVNDKADSAFGAIAVLDPEKITGVTESTASPGFGFPPSAAELYYVRAELPRLPIDPDSSTGKDSFDRSAILGQDGSLTLYCSYRASDRRPRVSYTFDNHMTLQAVFLDDNSREVLKDRYLKDRSGAAFDRFLEQVRAGVSYWDGREWTRTPTGVNQSIIASAP